MPTNRGDDAPQSELMYRDGQRLHRPVGVRQTPAQQMLAKKKINTPSAVTGSKGSSSDGLGILGGGGATGSGVTPPSSPPASVKANLQLRAQPGGMDEKLQEMLKMFSPALIVTGKQKVC